MYGMSATDVFKALVVELIFRLWGRGLYHNNKLANLIKDNWFDYWVEFKTRRTMADVDEQVTILNPNPVEIPEPIYWEETEGETPLGGPMGFSYDFVDSPRGDSDSVQGPE